VHRFEAKLLEIPFLELVSKSLDFIILDEDYKCEIWSKGAIKCFPSLLSSGVDSDRYKNVMLKKEREPRVVFLDYLKNILEEEEFSLLSSYIKDSDSASHAIIIPCEKKIAHLSLSVTKLGHFTLIIITKLKDVTKSLRLKMLSLRKKSGETNLFIANTSHEIRTPIQTILTVMDLLDETKLDAEQIEYTRQIRFSASTILTLVNDILDFSKLELGKMQFEAKPFNLADVVENTIDLISMEAHKKGLEVIIDVDTLLPDFIIGDANRLRQVILNLVKNAVKFTSKGFVSCIVSLSAFKKEDDVEGTNKPAILFEIKDSGIGVPKEKKDKLFNQFYQIDASTARKYGGTGLGLSICKNIVKAMNGSIGIKDNKNGGSIFYFKIPIVQAKISSSYENMLLALDTKFLLCDDNPATLRALKEMLMKLGFKNITLADSAEKALSIIKMEYYNHSFFDIAFIDMIMPKMDGWRLIAEIERFPDLIDTMFYLMIPEGTLTGDAKMKLLKWFSGYIYKPIKRRVVFDLLNNIYRKKMSNNVDVEDIGTLESINIIPKENSKNLSPAKEPKEAVSDKFINVGKIKNILVVDDHPVNKQLLKLILEKNAYSVKTAEDGMDAISKVKEFKFDLIFMDVQMPILDGYEATKKIRGLGFDMPIIACTAGSQEKEKDIALSFGMDDILQKPFTKEDLFVILNEYLN